MAKNTEGILKSKIQMSDVHLLQTVQSLVATIIFLSQKRKSHPPGGSFTLIDFIFQGIE